MSAYSIVDFRASHEGYSCGYCHHSDTNFSHGMWAHQLTVVDYQDLIDRGWRRSGKYTYKPTLNKTCCPQYPIRCNVTDLQLSKSQKKIIKRVNQFLNYDRRPMNSTMDDERGHCHQELSIAAKPTEAQLSEVSDDTCTPASDAVGISEHEVTSNAKELQRSLPKPGTGADLSKPKAKKAKLLRLEKKQAKVQLASSGANVGVNANAQGQDKVKCKVEPKSKSLEDHLNDVIDNPAHTLELQLVRSSPRSQVFCENFSVSHRVYHKYQTTIHGDSPSKPSEKQFTRFLVDSPLTEPPSLAERGKRLPDGFGSFHQHYVLDGKIIAVGVIDILPNCVSSVYFFYDPEFAFLSLGTYSALRELAFTRSLNLVDPAIRYYYLGFYIHSCAKMKYKAQYVPSFLCCPETYKWFSIEDCRPKLDANKYSRFASPDDVDVDQVRDDADIDNILCLCDGTAVKYRSVRGSDSEHSEVRQYAELTGRTCSQRMLLCR